MVKIERNILYSLPLISIVFEILKSFMSDNSPIMGVRNIIFFAFMLYLVIKYFAIAVKLNVFLIILMSYLLVLLVISGAESFQYNYFMLAFIAKMLFPLGFVFTYTYSHLQMINKKLIVTNILFVCSIIIFSIFGIGENQYGGNTGFSVGYFNYSSIYIGSFLLLAMPVMFSDLNRKVSKNLIVLLSIATLIILVLSVRRTAIVFVIIGIIVYGVIFRQQLLKFGLQIVALVIVLVLCSPLYKDILMRQIEVRSNIVDRGVGDIEEETRYEESVAVFNERILNPDIRIFLFGDHLFDSKGNYDNGVHKSRPIHLDLNIILHGSGIVGLIIFISFYISIYVAFLKYKINANIPNEKLLSGAFMAMYWSHVFLLFSGGFFTITFNLISFLYMGAILGIYKRANENQGNKMDSISNTNVEAHKPFVYKHS